MNINRNISRTVSEPKENYIEVEGLLREIRRLEDVIESYRVVLLKMRQSYLQLESELQGKVMKEHLIDVLKKQIEGLQVLARVFRRGIGSWMRWWTLRGR